MNKRRLQTLRELCGDALSDLLSEAIDCHRRTGSLAFGGFELVEIIHEYKRRAAFTHYYAWKNNSRRAELYGRHCRIVARGTMNSIMIEFADGERCVVSRNSVRRLEANPTKERSK